ncbi:MAG TPA: hypothetical protein VN908_07210 [Gemmatimonadales bacterium]|nr:hypothetical protein [Gemmatimonadales bacterium]
MRRIWGVAAAVAVVVAGLSCGKSGTGPTAGNLNVRLISPNSGADSAIVITITGPTALTSATPGPGLRLFQQTLGSTTRFALVGQLNSNATILTVGVADVNAVSQYSGSVDGVALPNYQLRPLPGGYALAVIR